MEKKADYAFVLTDGSPDFFGVLVSIDPNFVVLEKPMIAEYTAGFEVVFNSDFMPLGYPPRYDKAFRATVPVCKVRYIVHLDEDDSLTQQYLRQCLHREDILKQDSEPLSGYDPETDTYTSPSELSN